MADGPISSPPEGRVLIAPDNDALVWEPDWQRLDDNANLVASYEIDRGRQYELDRTDGGRATVWINDQDGLLDPTNTFGPFYNKIEPLVQILLQRYNPVTETWHSRFRGFIEDYDYEFDPSQRVNRLVISCTDIFEILQAIEMQPGAFGDPPPAESTGNVFFDTTDVKSRMEQVAITNASIPAAFFVFFTGNAEIYETVYSPGETVLSVIQDAADAEFPGVGNFYPDRFGRGVFHGRLAKFDPSGTWSAIAGTDAGRNEVWALLHLKAGDGAAVNASLSDTAQIREFSFNRGLSKIINSAHASPLHIADADIAGQLYDDGTSQGKYGIRSWSKENLLTKEGLLDGSDPLTETKRFAQFYVDNYKQPRNRVTQMTFRSLAPDDPRAPANWKLLCGCDIADTIAVTIASPGGGGFNLEPFFIEGVHERSEPLDPLYDNVTLSLDVSPQAYFTGSNPFPTGT